MFDYNADLKKAGYWARELLEPQIYLVSNLGDFIHNRGSMRATDKLVLTGRRMNGFAFVDVASSCLYDSFDSNRGAITDVLGTVDVSLDFLPSLASLDLKHGARLHEIRLQYNPKTDAVYLAAFNLDPSSRNPCKGFIEEELEERRDWALI